MPGILSLTRKNSPFVRLLFCIREEGVSEFRSPLYLSTHRNLRCVWQVRVHCRRCAVIHSVASSRCDRILYGIDIRWIHVQSPFLLTKTANHFFFSIDLFICMHTWNVSIISENTKVGIGWDDTQMEHFFGCHLAIRMRHRTFVHLQNGFRLKFYRFIGTIIDWLTSMSQPCCGPDWNRISFPFDPTDSKFKNANQKSNHSINS